MTDNFLDKVYRVSGNDGMRDLYNAWAGKYDQDILETGYATPDRVAAALSAVLADKNAPILDFGCGTGLSGIALAEAGFPRIDGTDLSGEMLAMARKKKIYNKLWEADPSAPLPVEPGIYRAVTAIGVISVGGAPAPVYDDLLAILAPGDLLAFSLNDQSMAMDDYGGRVKRSVSDGKVAIRSEAYGPHLAAHGENSGSTVYVLERL
jgi:predicted TPR repeat methyltransferase